MRTAEQLLGRIKLGGLILLFILSTVFFFFPSHRSKQTSLSCHRSSLCSLIVSIDEFRPLRKSRTTSTVNKQSLSPPYLFEPNFFAPKNFFFNFYRPSPLRSSDGKGACSGIYTSSTHSVSKLLRVLKSHRALYSPERINERESDHNHQVRELLQTGDRYMSLGAAY
jgi:hypothetical protein